MKEIRARIDAYFKLVLKNVRDSIPKNIGFFLVKKSQDLMQFELYEKINSNPNIANALGEAKVVTERRNTLKSTIDTLRNSIKLL